MARKKTPEAGTRTKVKTAGGEQIAIWTGHVWASEDGGRLIDAGEIKSWTEAPCEGELTIKMPDGTIQKVTGES